MTKYIDTEHDTILTIEQLEAEYNNLRVNNETESETFNIYIKNCTDKNGTLVKLTSNLYVCQLPQSTQDEIIAECTKVFESLAYEVNIQEEIENILNSKLSDISDTIDISKYLAR